MPAAREPEEIKVPEGLQEGALVAGKYRIGKPLGAGGMGLVLGAVHEALGTTLAIKVIHRESLRDPSLPARFVQEGRAAAILKSEHVVRVHDLGTLEDGTPYLAMERLEGVDLGALLDERPRLTFEEAVEIIRQTCDALGEAHGLGIVHRDLKPQNLFLVQRPGKPVHVKVLDFGIAKFLSQEQFQLQIATHSTAIMGSPIYMAPEQMRAAKSADGRSDLWSLGVIFYQLLVGKVPFQAESLPELCAMVLTEKAPPIDAAGLGLPEGIRDVVGKLLQTDPALRFQTADEVLEALTPYVTTRPVIVAEVGQLALKRARELDSSPVRSARITPHGDGRDIRPDGATVPALQRGSSASVKTVVDKGSKSGIEAAALSAEPGAEPTETPPPTMQSGRSRTRTASTTTQRRLRKSIAEVLAEHEAAPHSSKDSGSGRAIIGLLLLAVGAGGGLYMWKFHKAPFAPLQDAVSPAASASAKSKNDDLGPRIPLHAPSGDPSPHASAPAAVAPGQKPKDHLATDAGPAAVPVHDAGTPPAPTHEDAGLAEEPAGP